MYSFIAQFNSVKLQLSTCIWLLFFSGSHKLSTAEHASSHGTSKYGRNVFNVSFGFKNNSYILNSRVGWHVFWVKVMGRCSWVVVNLYCLSVCLFLIPFAVKFFPFWQSVAPPTTNFFLKKTTSDQTGTS